MRSDQSYFFCGIGGSGMSGIAQILVARGARVLGSDRSHDEGKHADLFANLARQGIKLVPQDGSRVDKSVDALIVSSAVELSIPDVGSAQAAGVPIMKRAELLAGLFNGGDGVAVGGTSGKSTVTGMIGHILHAVGKDPTVVSGGRMRNFDEPPLLGNAINGSGPIVIEADESDGTIELYTPRISVLTNISFDHMPMDELKRLFRDFCERSEDPPVMNADCEVSMEIAQAMEMHTFGFADQVDIRATDCEATTEGMRFTVDGVPARIPLPGLHNVANTLAAMTACLALGVPVAAAVEAMTTFKGTARRLEVLGTEKGVTVIDDFAHNPDKIRAALAALKAFDGPIHVMFQPHGFGPTRMLKEGIVASLTEGLGKNDHVWMPEIYYAGGTADRSISSRDLIDEVGAKGIPATFIADREALGAQISEDVKAGDRVVVMGARDDSLTTFGRQILTRVAERPR